MTDASSSQPPGWFPNPADSAEERWWDGRGWTEFTRPRPERVRPSEDASASGPALPGGGATTSVRRGVPAGAVVAIALGALLVGAVGGGAVGAAAGAIGASTSAAHRSPAHAQATQAAALPSETPPPAFEYDKDLFSIKIKVLSKECFGSAGCNVDVEPVLSVFDASVIPDDASGSITYEITGGEDGPDIETIDLTGTQYTPERTVISTTSSSKKLKIRITDVETTAP